MTAHPVHDWFARLRARTGLADIAGLLARAVGEQAPADAAGVFLLDYTGQNLLLYAAWPEQDRGIQPQRPALSLNLRSDPLCFSLQEGKPYSGPVQPGMPPYPSLALLPLPARPVRCLTGLPLLAWDDTCIGGMLLASAQDGAALAPPLRMLIDFGALLLESRIRQHKDHALLASLREDVHRLDTQQRAREQAMNTLLIGRSRAMRQVRELIVKAAPGAMPVLITGETGTGKELAAAALHAASPRRAAPLVKINCAALPAPLLESELFGHKKGSFSGAATDHIVLLHSGAGGTVLLDEIGEMPLAIQVKLLRVLQDRQVRPVGHIRSYPVDIRILSATNADLEQAIAAGAFRRDLFHRLCGFHIHIPPLRERREDIPMLMTHCLENIARRLNRGPIACDPDAMRLFLTRPFPGNVRQLFAELEQAVVVAGSETPLAPAHFCAQGRPPLPGDNGATLQEYLGAYEQILIDSVVACFRGNITKAAQALGVPRTTLSSKLQKNHRLPQCIDNG